jgi:hypothetical protein
MHLFFSLVSFLYYYYVHVLYVIKDKQIKYVHWQNTHKVEENGGEL